MTSRRKRKKNAAESQQTVDLEQVVEPVEPEQVEPGEVVDLEQLAAEAEEPVEPEPEEVVDLEPEQVVEPKPEPEQVVEPEPEPEDGLESDEPSGPEPAYERGFRTITATTAPSIGSALLRVGLALVVVFGGLGVGLGYWQVVEATSLTNDPGNPLVQLAARTAPRGLIYDATGQVVATNDRRASGERFRVYPDLSFAPVIGYQSLFFGTAGLERTYDAEMTGLKPLGAGGEVWRKFLSDPYDPTDLHLSIDARFQQAAMAALGNDRGAVVAIEPSTGRILALASTPSYDPNRLMDSQGGAAYLAELREQRSAPLLNRATQGRYVPGSIFKIVTAAAGLGSGVIQPGTTYASQPEEYSTGFRVQGFWIHDSPREFQTDHPLDLYEATEVSSNIYFAHAGLDIGADRLMEWSERLGFGRPIDFELPTEPSQINGGDGSLAGFQDRVELANAAYGQAETLATPLQMAMIAACIANDGEMLRPHLVDRLRSESGQEVTVGPSSLGRPIGSGEAEILTRAMVQAVEGEYGRFFAGDARIDGVTVAGKSGTAQLGEGQRPHSWFIGFAPAEQPRIAIAVIVERGGAGRERAVPIGGELMETYLNLGG